MEALLFFVNSLIVVVLVFQGLRDDRRAAGAPATSIFRTRDLPDPRAARQTRREVPAPAPEPWDLPGEDGMP